LIFVAAKSALSQSLFLDGEYILPNRAAGMSAYVADPDYAHAVLLNPARLAFVQNVYVGSDFEYFSRNISQPLSPDSSSRFLANGILQTWDLSAAFPAGPLGVGVSYNNFQLGGWRTTISALGFGVQLPFGFSFGITGKYLTFERLVVVISPVPFANYLTQSRMNKFTFDVGVANRTVLADNMFFRAIFSAGTSFSNVLSSTTMSGVYPLVSSNPDVKIPQLFSVGVAYTFASNYQIANFELFKLTAVADYSHLLSNSNPLDSFIAQKDQYRLGLETTALGVLAVRVGYTLKTPKVTVVDQSNNLQVSQMGTGFSYGFSLRFPTKLVLPNLPIMSLELSYAKNPEWNSGIYHDLFGVVCEMQF